MPVEGALFDLKRYAIHDGPGIRTSVFLRGCPLNCWWCHNPESRCPSAAPDDQRGNGSRASLTKGSVPPDDVIDAVARDVPYYDQSGGGVTFTGGEPLMQFEFLTELLKACRRRSIHTAVDTTGYAPGEKIRSIVELVGLFLYDLKIMDAKLHQEHVGVSNRLILDNLKMLADLGCAIIIRVPMIPGITDTPENIEAICAFVKPLSQIDQISLLEYHHYFHHKVKDPAQVQRLGELRPQTDEQTASVVRRFESHGFKIKVGG
ncbi:MAG: glycyl-radical enzyme activating protein [candidate division Zixibacteria bacterium]|nr:glycyl-radical enzyme activating protein [candidate division Zixibacteria bacterium]MDH3938753.1 glycyl-radical enzyme activating protein [candidate division Zixibacteria bacterium]MDH4032806.1 glycyl-radical enzyme activating protein [candidate division Zixibacteria bacterium]